MLILSRKVNESIVIDGRIVVTIVRVDGDQIKLGIQAPSDVPVHRQEVYDEIQKNNREALTQIRPKLPRLISIASSFENHKSIGEGVLSSPSTPR